MPSVIHPYVIDFLESILVVFLHSNGCQERRFDTATAYSEEMQA